MNESRLVAAEILASTASTYASFAAEQLLEQSPKISGQFGDGAFESWRTHFRQQILELSVSVAEGVPRLFSARVEWSRLAFQARRVSEDVLRHSLECLRAILQEKLSAEHASSVLENLDAGLRNFEQPLKGSEGKNELSPLALSYLSTALEGNSRDAIQLVVEAAQAGKPIEELYQDVLLAAQDEIGEMWHNAEVSVAEEHYVSATTLRAMAIICHQSQRKEPIGLSVVAAAVATNTHDIGLRAVSNLFELAGWNSICLGGDVPSAQVAQAVDIFQAPLLLLSATLITQISDVREAIRLVREVNPNCKIIVGGTAFRDVPDHWRQVGADAYAINAEDALDHGARLVRT